MKALYFENRLPKILMLKVAQTFSRYAALGPFSPLRYDDVPEPRLPGPQWLKVRNLSCGLCGTDVHFMFMDMDPGCFPAATPGVRKRFLGHETVAEVIEVGAQVDTVAVGDRVTMRIDWPSCYQMEIEPPCRQCAAGYYMLCENLGLREAAIEDRGGGFSPYMVMHRTQPHRIPEGLSNDAAVLIEPTASAFHGVMKHPPADGDNVLVVGGGTIGLLTVALLKHRYPETRVHCLVRYPFQARVAAKYGAHVIDDGSGLYSRMAQITGARYAKGYFGNEILLGGFDVIYDTVGTDRSLQDAVRWVRGRGTVVLVGINFKPGKIDYSPIWCQEVNVVGINCHATEEDGRTSFEAAVALLGENYVDPGDIITHRFPMDAYQEAVKAFVNKSSSRAIKIVLDHP